MLYVLKLLLDLSFTFAVSYVHLFCHKVKVNALLSQSLSLAFQGFELGGFIGFQLVPTFVLLHVLLVGKGLGTLKGFNMLGKLLCCLDY